MTTQFKIRINKQARTITLWLDGNKYRTIQLSTDEFDAMQDYTAADWRAEFKNGTLYSL